jgi:hypothetical protein
LLPQTDADAALALSRRIETVFAETLQGLPLTVSVSMDHGVATFPIDGEQADELIRVADERLYRLKHANHRKLGSGETRPAGTPALGPAVTSAAGPVAPPAQPAPQVRTAVSIPPPAAASVVTESPARPAPPISIEFHRALEKPEATMAASAAASMPAAEIAPQAPKPMATEPTSQALYTAQRKAERVSMTGTNAYAMLGEQNTKRARVVDLGFGGVAIELDQQESLPTSILAVLHVPILPPVRVSLKPIWSQLTKQGGYRIGCAFIS